MLRTLQTASAQEEHVQTIKGAGSVHKIKSGLIAYVTSTSLETIPPPVCQGEARTEELVQLRAVLFGCHLRLPDHLQVNLRSGMVVPPRCILACLR